MPDQQVSIEDKEKEFRRAQKRMRNQARYSNVDILTQYQMKDGRDRFSFERDTRGAGLLSYLIEHWTFRANGRVWFIPDQFISEVIDHSGTEVARGSGGVIRISTERAQQFLTTEELLSTPVAFPFLYSPPVEDGQKKPFQYRSILASLGLLLVSEKWLWATKHPVFPYVNRTFRQAVEMQPYVGALMVPVKPGGVLLDCPLVVKSITSDGIRQGRDGSGLIHPLHPLVSQLREAGHEGFSIIQIRIWNSRGFFAKGILELTEEALDSEGLPTVVIDTKMVKGAGKSKAKQVQEANQAITTVAHIGVIDVMGRGKISCTYEFWENIQNNDTTWEIVERKLKENFARFAEQGFEGALDQLRKTHHNLNQAIQFLEELNRGLGKTPGKLDVLQIPWVWNLLQEDLQARLYRFAIGAGIRMPTLPVIADDRVPRGHCVLRGKAPGTRMVGFRMPIVASQVITALTVAEPQPHHCFAGEEEAKPGVVYLNSHDICTRMAGDDDGDVVGISDDPDLVELANNLVDNRVFKIEGGVGTLDMLTMSPEGQAHVAVDQQGPVGKLTYMRSRLLVAGLTMPAVAVSCLIQESIDRAKKTIHGSNWELSSDIANWDFRDGVWHLKEEARLFNGEIRTGELDLRAVTQWVNRQLVKAIGGTEEVSQSGKRWIRPHEAIAWMTQDKNCLTGTWNPTQDMSPVEGNLVHRIHDTTWALWQGVADRFTKGETIPLDTLLIRLLAQKGIAVKEQDQGWIHYRNHTRERVGINRYGEQSRRAMRMPRRDDEEIKHHRAIMDRAASEFHGSIQTKLQSGEITIQDLVDCWLMETRYQRTKENPDLDGNTNYAFQAVVWPGSPIMALLGIKPVERCQFLTPEREKRILETVLNPSSEDIKTHGLQHMDKFQRLTSLMLNSQLHGRVCHDAAGKPIPGWDCPDCVDRLRIGLVRGIRTNAKASEHQYFKGLIETLNSKLNR